MADQKMAGSIRRIVLDEEGKPKGFGFVRANDSGKDYFFHHSALPKGVRLEQLTEGQTVEFVPGPPGPKGARAEVVFPL